MRFEAVSRNTEIGSVLLPLQFRNPAEMGKFVSVHRFTNYYKNKRSLSAIAEVGQI